LSIIIILPYIRKKTETLKKVLLLLLALFTLTSCEKEPQPIDNSCECVFIGEAFTEGSYSFLDEVDIITDCSREGELRWEGDAIFPQNFKLACHEGSFDWFDETLGQ